MTPCVPYIYSLFFVNIYLHILMRWVAKYVVKTNYTGCNKCKTDWLLACIICHVFCAKSSHSFVENKNSVTFLFIDLMDSIFFINPFLTLFLSDRVYLFTCCFSLVYLKILNANKVKNLNFEIIPFTKTWNF